MSKLKINEYKKLNYDSSLDNYPEFHKHLTKLILHMEKCRDEIDAITKKTFTMKKELKEGD